MKSHDYTTQGWGWAISLIIPKDDGSTTMMGHGHGIKDGDELLVLMRSGKVGIYAVNKVEYRSNPRDLWSADVSFKGYKEPT